MEAITLTAYAKRRNVSKMAVSRAVKSGRLRASVARDASGKLLGITDPDLADKEWDAATDYSRAPGTVRDQAAARREAAAPEKPRPPPAGGGEAPSELNLFEEQARERHWKANTAELEYRKRCGELVETKEIEGRVIDAVTQCKTKLLGLPSRARLQDPTLTRGQLDLIETLVREALEDLAGPEEAAVQ